MIFCLCDGLPCTFNDFSRTSNTGPDIVKLWRFTSKSNFKISRSVSRIQMHFHYLYTNHVNDITEINIGIHFYIVVQIIMRV